LKIIKTDYPKNGSCGLYIDPVIYYTAKRDYMKQNDTTPDNKPIFYTNNVEVNLSPIHGYGVFATKDIAPKDIIEICPIFTTKFSGVKALQEFMTRVFSWNDEDCAVALGYGAIYNHADQPNATVDKDYKNLLMKFVANQPIAAGSEILHNYGKNWFALREQESSKKIQKLQELQELQKLQDITQNRKDNRWSVKIMLILVTLLILSIVFPNNSFTDSKSQKRLEIAYNSTGIE